LRNIFDVVGHDQDRLGRELAGLPELEQLGAEVLRGEHVERAERLVHQQQVGLDDERAGKPDALAHPTGQFLGERVLEPVEANQFDRPQGALGSLLGLDALRLEPKLDVPLNGQPWQQSERLKQLMPFNGLPR
jgi:hypothetical protein